jgi:alpha-galactosidase
LTTFGKQALTNDEVLAVDRSGHPATQITAGFTPVWASSLGNGAYYVALFNLNALPSSVTFDWKDVGFQNAIEVRDLWSHAELGPSFNSFSTILPGHGARLFLVRGVGHAPASPSQAYDGSSAILHGAANIQPCPLCASGSKITYLGIGADNYATFADVEVKKAGVYRMEVDSLTNGTRSYIINVNGGPNITLNSSGGSGNVPSQLTIPVKLNAGINSIEFGNPVSYPPDLDRIVISGDGNEPYPTATTYEGEYATLTGSGSGGFCGNCSGLAKAGNLGAGATATFTNVNVPAAGTYNMEIDYLTSGPRSYFLSVNDGTAQELDLNGTSFNSPASTVIPVQLNAGDNTIAFSNPSNYAPDLDSITISPVYK